MNRNSILRFVTLDGVMITGLFILNFFFYGSLFFSHPASVMGVFIGSWAVSNFLVTQVLHRGYGHGACERITPENPLWWWLTSLVGWRDPLRWREHIVHHLMVDTEDDMHSPITSGKLYAFLLWFTDRNAPQSFELRGHLNDSRVFSRQYDRIEETAKSDSYRSFSRVSVWVMPAFAATLWACLGWQVSLAYLAGLGVTFASFFALNTWGHQRSISKIRGEEKLKVKAGYSWNIDNPDYPRFWRVLGVLVGVLYPEFYHRTHHILFWNARSSILDWTYFVALILQLKPKDQKKFHHLLGESWLLKKLPR